MAQEHKKRGTGEKKTNYFLVLEQVIIILLLKDQVDITIMKIFGMDITLS